MIGIGLGLNKFFSGGGTPSGSFDVDAQTFITAAAITDSTEQGAINTLVTELKNANIWNKMRAVYPFVGGSASSAKFNLKNPVDSDAAYRISFTSGWTFTNGAKPNGIDDFGNTFFGIKSVFPDSVCSFGGYTTESIPGGSSFFGAGDLNLFPANNNLINLTYDGGGVVVYFENYPGNTYNQIVGPGMITFSNNESGLSIYHNNTPGISDSIKAGFSTFNFNLGGAKDQDSGNLNFNSWENLGFWYFSEYLDSTDSTNLNTIVSAFQTTLSRNI